MEFFGIGAPELMVVLVIAIVLFGPDKIPTMAAQVGKTIREFRRYTSDLTKEFDAATGDLRQEFQTIAGDLKGELAATQADLRSQLDLTDVFKMDTPKAAVAAATAPAVEPETQPLVAESAVAIESVAASEPAPTETITVTTAYADSLAAASTATVDTPAAEAPVAVATKANPFADLATLVVDTPRTEPVTIFTADAEISAVAESPMVTTESQSETTAPHTNGKRKAIGGSVAGSKYSRAHATGVSRRQGSRRLAEDTR